MFPSDGCKSPPLAEGATLVGEDKLQRYTISELAAASGVSAPSIKFYLREGLLAAGNMHAEGRAHYEDTHLARLRLIRALRDVAHLPIATIRGVLAAIAAGGPLVDVVASALDALHDGVEPQASAAMTQALADIRELLATLSVQARSDSGAVHDLAAALVKLRQVWGANMSADKLVPYAEVARRIARREVAAQAASLARDPATVLEVAVLGTVLFEPVLLAFRRVMHEHLVREIVEKPISARKQTKPKPARPGR